MAAVVCVTATTAAAQSSTAPELQVDSEVATAGFYQLRWYSDEPVELEEADNPEFWSAEVIYSGSDAARVMSGKSDGVFYYRVHATDGGLSNVIKVTVRHHSLERALAFFSLGAIVFLATLMLIATGARGSTGPR